MTFEHLGEMEDLHIEVFSDASLGNVESGMHTKSAMGYFICLAKSVRYTGSPASLRK